jgi:hypothetical protein
MKNRFGFITATGNDATNTQYNATCTDSCFRIDDDTIGRLIGFRSYYLGIGGGHGFGGGAAVNGRTTGMARMWGVPKI